MRILPMVECGMDPLEAIRAATIVSARMNGIDGEVGALAEGLKADVIAVAGDPVEDVTCLASVCRAHPGARRQF